MRTIPLAKLIIICCLTCVAAMLANAQDDSQTRSITSDDFSKQRPASKSTVGKPGVKRQMTVKPKHYTYKFVRTDKNVVSWNKGSKTAVRQAQPANLLAKITEIGVTMWKLR